jgi:hypothetical protein
MSLMPQFPGLATYLVLSHQRHFGEGVGGAQWDLLCQFAGRVAIVKWTQCC